MNGPRRVLCAGMVLGAGLGGFVDGIVMHQLAQWHNTISAIEPPDDLVAAKVNMYWDGVFHVGVWALTALGVYLLWSAGRYATTRWSGELLWGGLLLGWGAFNLVEGVINHHLLGLHHVHETTPHRLAFDLGFLAFGALLAAAGLALARRGWLAPHRAPGSIDVGRDPIAAGRARRSPSGPLVP